MGIPKAQLEPLTQEAFEKLRRGERIFFCLGEDRTAAVATVIWKPGKGSVTLCLDELYIGRDMVYGGGWATLSGQVGELYRVPPG